MDKKAKKALLVGVYKGAEEEKKIAIEHLEELKFLAMTWGVETKHTFPCVVRKFEAATFVTKGKLEEIAQLVQELEADLVIFDDEISPAQQRNLEKEFKIPVIDRTEVILGVFADRAQTKEAKLQVELAKIKYEAPRLKRLWTHLSRQAGTVGGGGAYLKGVGEKQIEIDRRLLKDKISKLEEELEVIKLSRETQRKARERGGIPTFAIIGYTNVGKSSLLNSLTDAGTFVEDKLFATLDTTTRKFMLKGTQPILLIDTVGFIRKLPHHLVAAFKSTLEEALFADILLHVVDASHKMAIEQAETTLEVLKELGAKDKPIITLLNKIDLIKEARSLNGLRLRLQRTIPISALKREGFNDLEEACCEELKKRRCRLRFRIPQSDYGLVSLLTREGTVIEQKYEENDVLLEVDLPKAIAEKYTHLVCEN
jgi:GTP-binding protein HflX